MTQSIDAVHLHKDIIEDYKSFVHSFINIKNESIRKFVELEINQGKFWPEPLIQFNPSFSIGKSAKTLCDEGILAFEMEKIFKGFPFFEHQTEAIIKGSQGIDFIVTSGTGSGKSLIFLSTIFNYLLRNKPSLGIKAIIVYPMNALINSQFEEIGKFKDNYEKETGKQFPITYAKYTGQEKEDEREKIKKSPPDIILTNYMMLELIVTRPHEYNIRTSIYENLKYLVFDELHTYRGRQGSDVALLIRRIKAQTKNKVSCIGTSATMISGASLTEQKEKIAEVASKFFATIFSEHQIVIESLVRCFEYQGIMPSKDDLKKALENLRDNSLESYSNEENLKQSQIAIWLENKIALIEKQGKLIRNTPMKFSEIVNKLEEDSGLNKSVCEQGLKSFLLWLAKINEKKNNKNAYLPYKIHHFISQTGSVYVSLDNDENKIISLEPKISYGDEEIPLYPVVFSRISGYEFICVNKDYNKKILIKREFKEIIEEEENITSGYLIPYSDIWNPDTDTELLPESWGKTDKKGNYKINKDYKNRIPQKIYYDRKGNFSDSNKLKYEGWFMPAKLLFDPTSGVFYDTKTSENTKLTRIGSEARSTSTTILSFSILKYLAQYGLQKEHQKLLSFTDNRQDAALQSGHFNDFIKVIQLRSAIYQALLQNKNLNHSNLSYAILKALSLPQEEYANNQSTFSSVIRENENTFKDLLMYRALDDLKRGWRFNLPNLEQCGLLEIDYKNLKENCQANEDWADIPLLNELSLEDRIEIVYQTLDYFRKSYAISSEEYLTAKAIDEKTKEMKEKLKPPWKLDDNEKIEYPCFLRYETLKHSKIITYTQSIGLQSSYGKYIRYEAKQKGVELKGENYLAFIKAFLELCVNAGWLHKTTAKNSEGKETTLYQLRIDAILWKIGDEKNIVKDAVKNRSYKLIEQKPNLFFQSIYKTNFQDMKLIIGKEHTGQLSTKDRIEREEKFRTGEYSVLFCSPTMELGIDIASLNIVHLRNVPPNPSNYAQRSGRSGRNGQAALIFTNCSAYSPHDMHYFNHTSNMVSGVVLPPRIDLINKELIETHLNALYLSRIGLEELNNSIQDIIENTADLPLKDVIKEKFKISAQAKEEIKRIFKEVVKTIPIKHNELLWLNDEWIEQNINAIPQKFDRALDRWRKLYNVTQKQLSNVSQIIESNLYPKTSETMKDALKNQSQALRQRDLLCNKSDKFNNSLSDFYPYRYLASEGFLPGYNFARLPIRAFIPIGNSGEYISRPRFIALREFGPRNVIYHNGSKYMIEQVFIPEIENTLKKAKISKNSGYIIVEGDSEYNNDMCPFSHISLSDGNNIEFFTNLLEMSETKTRDIERITCLEEERISRGYDIRTYFNMHGKLDAIITAKVKNEKENFLNIRFLPAAKLIQINKKWRATKEEGFLIGTSTGRWKKESQRNEIQKNDIISQEANKVIMLFTSDNADALYIEPIKALNLNYAGIVTLQYALKRAIEHIFQVEPNELGVELMGGGDTPNIFLYEASEGSLGILSQFVENNSVFKNVIEEAIKICRYDDTHYKEKASYNDLLDYYNQRYHDVINRFEIKEALSKLLVSNIEIITNKFGSNYDEQYNKLLKEIDVNSSTERKFLDYLYKNGLRLPDKAQARTKDIYSQPDFFYEPDIHVFCDGKHHDEPEIKKRDNDIRQAIRNNGEQVFVYYYRDKLDDIIAKRNDIFIKVTFYSL
ncbi:MAG: DEAD/DEAH box helicase [Desulfobacterales bacterium]|nr:DEAD/DEAH box helicase [Desulfobacterales bacterium]